MVDKSTSMVLTWMRLWDTLHLDIWELMSVTWICTKPLRFLTVEEGQAWGQSVWESTWCLSYRLIHSLRPPTPSHWERSHLRSSVQHRFWQSATVTFWCWARMGSRERQLMRFWTLITWWESYRSTTRSWTTSNCRNAATSSLSTVPKSRKTPKCPRRISPREWWTSGSTHPPCPSPLPAPSWSNPPSLKTSNQFHNSRG